LKQVVMLEVIFEYYYKNLEKIVTLYGWCANINKREVGWNEYRTKNRSK
jgi:hypothetical protein